MILKQPTLGHPLYSFHASSSVILAVQERRYLTTTPHHMPHAALERRRQSWVYFPPPKPISPELTMEFQSDQPLLPRAMITSEAYLHPSRPLSLSPYR